MPFPGRRVGQWSLVCQITWCGSRIFESADYVEGILPQGHHLSMSQVTSFVICFLMAALRSRLSLQLEVAALRHQLSVYQETRRRPLITSSDRLLWHCERVERLAQGPVLCSASDSPSRGHTNASATAAEINLLTQISQAIGGSGASCVPPGPIPKAPTALQVD